MLIDAFTILQALPEDEHLSELTFLKAQLVRTILAFFNYFILKIYFLLNLFIVQFC